METIEVKSKEINDKLDITIPSMSSGWRLRNGRLESAFIQLQLILDLRIEIKVSF